MIIRTKTLHTCAHCGKEFRRANRKNDPPKFCALACSNAYKTVQPSRCHPDKPNHALGLCISCYYRRYNTTLRDDPSKYRRELRLRKEYGITQVQWDKMYEVQEGKCSICLGRLHKFRGIGGHRAAAVDHDHGPSKRVRGLVCHVCNRSRVGKNTVETAKRLLAYLLLDFDGRNL